MRKEITITKEKSYELEINKIYTYSYGGVEERAKRVFNFSAGKVDCSYDILSNSSKDAVNMKDVRQTLPEFTSQKSGKEDFKLAKLASKVMDKDDISKIEISKTEDGVELNVSDARYSDTLVLAFNFNNKTIKSSFLHDDLNADVPPMAVGPVVQFSLKRLSPSYFGMNKEKRGIIKLAKQANKVVM